MTPWYPMLPLQNEDWLLGHTTRDYTMTTFYHPATWQGASKTTKWPSDFRSMQLHPSALSKSNCQKKADVRHRCMMQNSATSKSSQNGKRGKPEYAKFKHGNRKDNLILQSIMYTVHCFLARPFRADSMTHANQGQIKAKCRLLLLPSAAAAAA